MQKSKKPKDKKVNPVRITTESPTSRTGGGPMKEENRTRAAGEKKQRESGDKEDSMGSGKRQDDQ
ncbi:hypothetical protein ACQ86N_12335 [Puia sp. P3]|uniref:hypothetical protein n=1 Tax=Puia sp. P3 TaxID=3423952 RepID=UPI003D667D01